MVSISRRAALKRVYQLLVEFGAIEPRVWRRLWVRDTLTMAKLDRVIQTIVRGRSAHPPQSARTIALVRQARPAVHLVPSAT
jgi:hypothetical protein